jgi:hypothetical protein
MFKVRGTLFFVGKPYKRWFHNGSDHHPHHKPMNGTSKVLDLAGKETQKFAAEPVAAGNRWQLTAEFILTMALIGDALVIFAALRLGFWVRFDSGLIPFFADVKSIPVFFDYFNLLVMGTVFLLATFGYLRLYSQRCLMRYLQTAR